MGRHSNLILVGEDSRIIDCLRRVDSEMSEKLDRIEKLTVVFHNVSPEDLSQVVSEAIQLLEERRLIVIDIDTIDPDDFIDLVSVRTA